MEIKHFDLAVDGSRGIYVPKFFAENYPDWLDDDEKDILLSGPEHEEYWDAWDGVLYSERDEKSLLTGESGDVFIISNSPMDISVMNWSNSECLDDCPDEIKSIVEKLADEFATDPGGYLSENEALEWFSPSKYNDDSIFDACVWICKELKGVIHG